MVAKVNVDAVSQGIIGVFAAISSAISTLGDGTVAFFLEQIPERGEALWNRFKVFREENGGADFHSWIKSVVSSNGDKLFYPRECTLDQMTRQVLVSEIQGAIRGAVHSNDDVLQIFYGAGPVYEKAREVSCKGCPIQKCRHQLRSRRK